VSPFCHPAPRSEEALLHPAPAGDRGNRQLTTFVRLGSGWPRRLDRWRRGTVGWRYAHETRRSARRLMRAAVAPGTSTGAS